MPATFNLSPAASGTDFCVGTSTVLPPTAVPIHGVAVKLQRPQAFGLLGFRLTAPITVPASSAGPVGSTCRRRTRASLVKVSRRAADRRFKRQRDDQGNPTPAGDESSLHQHVQD